MRTRVLVLTACCLPMLAAVAVMFGVAIVCGGSMEPALLPGDVVVYRRGAAAGEGDVVVFDRPGWPGGVVHRVVAPAGGGAVCTKGDANPIPDLKPVPASRIRGRCVAVLPAGRLLAALDDGHR